MGYLLIRLLDIYAWILIVRVLMSWFNPNPFNPIVRLLYGLTEPVLEPVRRVLPPMGGFDLSPLVVFFAIMILKRLLFGF